MLTRLLLNPYALGAAALAVFLAGSWTGNKIGAPFHYRSGWSEGRDDLARKTSHALQEKNDAAAQADRDLRPCLLDPKCLRSDDGWRIDRTD